MAKDGVIVYEFMYDAVRELSPDEFKECMTAVFEYGFYGKELNTQGISKAFLTMSKPYIDRYYKNLETVSGRHCSEYAEWRKKVFERDEYTCQVCGKVGGKLNAHHIREYARYPYLRYEVSNGITLCEKCHKKVHRKEISI